MIKNALLNRKAKKATSKRKESNHSTYEGAESIGILYNSLEYSAADIQALRDDIKQDGKDVALLYFTERETEDQFSFCKKDVSVSGNLSKESVGFFTNRMFDFLISLDTSEDVNYKYVLSISKAICKVGLESEGYTEQLQLAFKPSGNPSEDIRGLLKYLRMI